MQTRCSCGTKAATATKSTRDTSKKQAWKENVTIGLISKFGIESDEAVGAGVYTDPKNGKQQVLMVYNKDKTCSRRSSSTNPKEGGNWLGHLYFRVESGICMVISPWN